MPPWLVLEFATVNRCNPEAGEEADFEDLANALRPNDGTSGQPVRVLRLIINSNNREYFELMGCLI